MRDILSKMQTTGYIIAEFEKLTDIPVRKALIDLLGSDLKRMSSILTISQLGKTYEKGEEGEVERMVAALQKLTRIDAYRLFSVLPGELTPEAFRPNCSEERTLLEEATFFYATVGLWLIDSHRSSRHTETLNRLGLADAKKRAVVSDRRYQVCEWLYAQRSLSTYSNFISVPGMWLLWEISVCRRRLRGKYKHGVKDNKYDYWVGIWKQLDNFGIDPDQDRVSQLATANSWGDFVEAFEWIMLADAKEMAESHTDIDTVIYKAYIQAERTWGYKAKKWSCEAKENKANVIPFL